MARGFSKPKSMHVARSERTFARAVLCHRQGDLKEAEKLYRQVLSQDSAHGEAWHHLGQIRAGQGQLSEAAILLRRAIKNGLNSAEAHNNLGVVLNEMRLHEEAAGQYEKALELDGGLVDARFNLGVALMALKRFDAAAECFGKVLAVRPADAAANRQLGLASLQAGRTADAIVFLARSIEIEPGVSEAHNNLGMAFQDAARSDEAIASFHRALGINPKNGQAHYNLGNALRGQKRTKESVAHYLTAIETAPGFAEAYGNLGEALQALGETETSIRYYEKAIELMPDFSEAHNNLGTALQALNRMPPAIAHFEEALRIRPDYPEALNNLGNALTEVGRLDEGIRSFERAVALAPRRMEFHRNLASFKRYTAGDPHLAAMLEMAEDMASLTEADQINLHFALGKASADAGDLARSMKHLKYGNALHRRNIVYDEAKTMGEFLSIRDAIQPDLLARLRGCGASSAQPIFVFGMPRSGTTLVEQIIASHPRVVGGGELPHLEHIFHIRFGSIRPGPPLIDALRAMSGEDWRRLGQDYLDRIEPLAKADRVTDKMTSNFRLAGIIHLALPGARLIHVMRNPVDTCVSCYSNLFTHSLFHTYDLSELGRYYRGYQALMEHWRRTLPAGAMFEVEYEKLVADFEDQSRQLIAYCGLDWNPDCLAYHRNPRPVRTASSYQVRQQVYRTSVGRWRAFESHLQPLLEALGPDNVR